TIGSEGPIVVDHTPDSSRVSIAVSKRREVPQSPRTLTSLADGADRRSVTRPSGLMSGDAVGIAAWARNPVPERSWAVTAIAIAAAAILPVILGGATNRSRSRPLSFQHLRIVDRTLTHVAGGNSGHRLAVRRDRHSGPGSPGRPPC